MKLTHRIKPMLLPLGVALLGFGIFAGLLATGPKIDPRPQVPVPPTVASQIIRLAPLQMTASAFGTVEPRSQTDLVAEVSGRVVRVSPNLVSGGFFSAGELLFEIDSEDYETQLEQANAGVARAASELAFATKDYDRQLDLKNRQSVSQSLEDEALRRLAAARANHREALAKKSSAERNLNRTQVRAPYQGRVRAETIDVGQYVTRGVAIAKLYATDFVEVRLPVQDQALAFLAVDLANSKSIQRTRPEVRLRANFAGTPQAWRGEIDRVEGEIDGTTRMVNLVARVPAPYEQPADRAPLAVGLFVEAEILGLVLPDVVELPRVALTGSNEVFVIDEDQKMRRRTVEVVRQMGDSVIIGGGLANGERVCLTPMDDAIEGMRVSIDAGAREVSQR